MLKPDRTPMPAAPKRPVVASLLLAAGLGAALVPSPAAACACGCGIFDVGAQSLPGMSELVVYFRYDYMNQNKNWEGNSSAPAADNADKEINTSFYTVGADYAVSDSWMVMAELPIFARHLTTTDDGTVFAAPGSIYTGKITDLGDLQVMANYTGLSTDMSTGLGFGVKLPTGNYTGPTGPLGGSEFDRDSLPGTGSTDLMVSAYHVGSFNAAETFSYFVQGRYQFAVLTRDDYRPGNELDAAAGVSYDIGATGPLDKLAGVLQLLASTRERDSGANADPLNSGYTRLLIAPGLDVQVKNFRVFVDVEFPVYQYTNAASSVAIEGTSGQLTASALYKVELAYAF